MVKSAWLRQFSFVAAVCAGCLTAGLSAAAPIFDFEANLSGASAPLTETEGGVVATFSSSGGAGEFIVFATGSFFQTLSGNALTEITGASGALIIGFSSLVNGVSLNFASVEAVNASLSAYLGGAGGTLVGTDSELGGGPGFPEGILSFSGASFDTLVLSTTASGFTVDNIEIEVAAAAAPEPMSLALLGIGVAGIGLARRRRGF